MDHGMGDFTFLKSYFTEPEIAGSNTSGLVQPFLQFFSNIETPNGEFNIVIRVDFLTEGLASDFRFHVVAKAIFKVLDPTDIVVTDIYEMYGKAITDLRAFLDYKIGKDGQST